MALGRAFLFVHVSFLEEVSAKNPSQQLGELGFSPEARMKDVTI